MAFEDKTLLDMLVAWASSHLSLCDDTYRIKALEHRSTALRSFTTALPKSQEFPDVSLACCLVFCSMSAILGDTAGWHNHLLGAAHIIRQASPSGSYQHGLEKISETYEGRWLLRNFAYHDVLMSVTLNRAPIISGRYWMNQGSMEVDSYVGLACEPLALISEISSWKGHRIQQLELDPDSRLDSDASSLSSLEGNITELPPSEIHHFLTEAGNFEAELQNWICPASDDVNLVHLAEAYRSAALIHLYRVSRTHQRTAAADTEHKIRSKVAAVIYHIGQMPLKCLPECTSLFPLFMAGGETKSKADMQFIRERLQHIIVCRHFQNAASALSVLEELWLQHTSITTVPGETLDWRDILEQRGWCLALS
jgi:transcriptional activator protein UGA3